jgi:hypothetical protein
VSGVAYRRGLLPYDPWALSKRERTRWYQLGAHLSFNPDLPLVDQVGALATLTVVGDQPCAMALLGRCRTRLRSPGSVWAHRL